MAVLAQGIEIKKAKVFSKFTRINSCADICLDDKLATSRIQQKYSILHLHDLLSINEIDRPWVFRDV